MRDAAAKRMRDILNGTGGYRLTGETSADWEVNACGAGLDALQNAVDVLLSDLFVSTASDARLAAWEKLFRPQPTAGAIEDRRETLGERFSMNPGRFRPGDFSSMLGAAGVAGQVLEESGGLRVLAGRLLGITEEEAKRELDDVLPAHLPWEWDESVNWAALDVLTPDFETLDGWELSWTEIEQLDRNGLEELKEEN